MFFAVEGSIVPVLVERGVSLLETAHKYGVPLKGACEGSLACTTCHVVMDRSSYERTKGSLTEREEDLLDSAKGLTLTSRLGCQVKGSKLLELAQVKIPRINKNVELEVQKRNES
ncbi:hypothetical protein NEHOM01_2149 [Nematocida homosporus]|uniref:uncharacterized protein n=1 Tax=Nematocida homosporus TaxID=1912981 RepID=UPI00221E3E95|nr:uncharacterized protein NEHOM01_2149 [Nematocida homosporus]KAI5187399.1 hypothetical protein NEHOM01_2149 [Nematocida homosporus]